MKSHQNSVNLQRKKKTKEGNSIGKPREEWMTYIQYSFSIKLNCCFSGKNFQDSLVESCEKRHICLTFVALLFRIILYFAFMLVVHKRFWYKHQFLITFGEWKNKHSILCQQNHGKMLSNHTIRWWFLERVTLSGGGGQIISESCDASDVRDNPGKTHSDWLFKLLTCGINY
jgi:hypothetical protein